MRKNLKQIPAFRTHQEAARFFDENDTTDLEFDSEGWEVFFLQAPGSRPKRSGRSVVHVPLDIDSRHLGRIRALAKRQGKTPREWLREAIKAALKTAER